MDAPPHEVFLDLEATQRVEQPPGRGHDLGADAVAGRATMRETSVTGRQFAF